VILYGVSFLGASAYYVAEWRSVDARTLRRRGVVRGLSFLTSLVLILFVLPFGPAIRLSRTGSQENVMVFLNTRDLGSGQTAAAMIRVNLPGPTLCDISTVELSWRGADRRVTVFRQKTFVTSSDGEFFGPVFHGGCSCRFGFRVPGGLDPATATFLITYKEAARRRIPFLIDEKEGSFLRTVPLLGQSP